MLRKSNGKNGFNYDGRKKLIGSVLGINDTATILDLQDATMNLLVDYNGNPVTVYFKKN